MKYLLLDELDRVVARFDDLVQCQKFISQCLETEFGKVDHYMTQGQRPDSLGAYTKGIKFLEIVSSCDFQDE